MSDMMMMTQWRHLYKTGASKWENYKLKILVKYDNSLGGHTCHGITLSELDIIEWKFAV